MSEDPHVSKSRATGIKLQANMGMIAMSIIDVYLRILVYECIYTYVYIQMYI